MPTELVPKVAGDSAGGDVATTTVDTVVVDASVIYCFGFYFSTFQASVTYLSDSSSV